VLAVRRDEADGVLRLELAELDALVELAVIDSDRRPGVKSIDFLRNIGLVI
jgi:hypothetical protein